MTPSGDIKNWREGITPELEPVEPTEAGCLTRAPEAANFDDYPILRLKDMPEVRVVAIDSEEEIGGIGEPGYPPLGPAVLNALYDATGRRIRKLPLRGNLKT